MSESGMEILVVDDDRGMVRTLGDVLRLHGWTVSTAHSGEEAVESIRERAIPLVLMDIKMDGIDGVEALKRIRELRPGTRVLLMTAYSASELVEEAERAGVMEVLSKPVALPHLLELVRSAAVAPRSVLVVDDDPDFLSALCDGLDAHGVPARAVASLAEALALLEEQAFKVVLLDLNLHGVVEPGSVAAIKELRPEVLVVLSSGHPDAMRRVANASPEGWILASLIKPFSPARLLEILEAQHG